MSDHNSTLEQNIKSDRTLLQNTLNQLSRALSPDRISQSVAREVETRGAAVGTTVMSAARANPAGAILVGVGLAALLAGPKHAEHQPDYDRRPTSPAQGQSSQDVLSDEFDRRLRAAEATENSEPMAPRLRAALNAGLANLPAPARARVLKTRQAVIDVQEQLDRKASDAARKARGFHYKQPLASGALAIGLGAIIAGVLPRTRTEDDMLGPKRDALLQQAELTLRDEIAAATSTGEAALREGIEAGYESLNRH